MECRWNGRAGFGAFVTPRRHDRGSDAVRQLQATADKAITGVDQSLAIITALLRLTEIENSRRSAGFGVVALDQLLREVCEVAA
jgi:hypothetical protein